MAKLTGGSTAKSHKSRKTEPATAPAGGTSSVSLAIPSLPEPPPRPVIDTPTEPSIATIMPAPEPPQKQWWYRSHDSKQRKIVEKIVVLDCAGWADKDIAKKLGTTAYTVRQLRYLGRKNGWIRTGVDGEEETVDIELELAMNVDRKIVRNIDASLDGHMTNWQTHEMTVAAAKGRGIFKGEVVKGPAAGELPVVAIQIVMPAIGIADQHINEAQVGGVPAYVEGEVEEKS